MIVAQVFISEQVSSVDSFMSIFAIHTSSYHDKYNVTFLFVVDVAVGEFI